MTDTDDWDGTERRVADKRLAVAIAEVRDLRDAAAKLAEAVQVRSDEFRRLLLQVAAMLAVLFIAIATFSLWQVARLNDRVDHGHDLITCLLLIEPAQRTAASLIECQK